MRGHSVRWAFEAVEYASLPDVLTSKTVPHPTTLKP